MTYLRKEEKPLTFRIKKGIGAQRKMENENEVGKLFSRKSSELIQMTNEKKIYFSFGKLKQNV